MPENREQSQMTESQAEQIKTPIHRGEQREAPNPFSLRLNQIRDDARVRNEKLSLLLGDSTKAESAERPEEPIPLDELSSQIEELSQVDLSPSEYLIRSGQLLKASEQARKRILQEHEAVQNEYYSHKNAASDIDDKLEELNWVRGWKRLTKRFDRKRLNQQKVQFEQKAAEQRTHAESKEQSNFRAGEREKEIRRKQEEIILNEVEADVSHIRNGYETFLGEVLQDGRVTSEIQEIYIHDVISPRLNEEVPADKKEAFLSALRKCLRPQAVSEKEREDRLEELSNFIRDNNFYGVVRLNEPLLEGVDRNIITEFIAKIAASDIERIKITVRSRIPKHEIYSHIDSVDRALTRAINPDGDSWRNKNSFQSVLLTETSRISEPTKRQSSEYPNMHIWNALKTSQSATDLFGELINAEDDGIYTTALEKSLSDTQGTDIDILAYYPRPEAIRNLVILAAADYSNYRTVHANEVLTKLASRENWNEILDQTEQVYPTLKTARPFLEHWDYSEQSSNPGAQEAVKNFATAILADESVDKRLADLAIQSLPNSSLLEVLHQKGIIPDERTVTSLQEAQAILDKLENDKNEDIKNNRKTDLPYISGYQLKKTLRSNLLNLMSREEKEIQKRLDSTKRLSMLSQAIIENKNDYAALDYLSDGSVIDKLAEDSFANKNAEMFISAYKDCPALLEYKFFAGDYSTLLSEFCKQFSGQETIKFFNDVSIAYKTQEEHLLEIVRLVGKDSLSQARAIELPAKAEDVLSSPKFPLAIEYPNLYLKTDADSEFFKKMAHVYQDANDVIKQISQMVSDEKLNRELALTFPQQASTLMDDKMKEIRSFVLSHADSMLKDGTDLRFLNTVAGEFGRKSDIILKGYQECLEAGVVTTAEKDLVLEFGRQFRVISPTTLSGYKEAKEAGHEKVYTAQLTALAEKMTGSAVITDEERAKPFYKDLLKHVYSNNSGQWTSFESNDSCSDRTSDLAGFKIKPRYELDLLSQSEIRVKSGETLNPQVQEEVQAPIFAVSAKMNEAGFDYERIKADLGEELDKKLKQVAENGSLADLNLENVTTQEEKLFLILTDSIYGTNAIDNHSIKNLLITYEFANFEDISDYIAGTRDRVGRANNQDYALLCEVGAFYSDRIKEVNRRLVESAWNNPAIAEIMPEYFKKLAQETVATGRQDRINRLQVDKLGLTDNFISQIGRVLEKRKGRKYEPDEVREIVSRYENLTGSLSEKASVSKKPLTRAFYGQLRSQREKTIEAMKVITGEEIDPKKVNLGEVNLQQILDTETNILEGKYDDDQFASYTVQRFIDLFEDERVKINGELSKFESITGKQREVLHGYITKAKETAHARMVGGVCVAGDNPGKYPEKNMWDMPNYFQLVLQEPDTLQCQGLALLHHFTEGDKKILTASLNPSSTYLYSVDEAALLRGIMGSLEQFASENSFDIITLSQNKAIRTNRTGGQFEKSMDEKIAQVGKTFRFDTPQEFSYHLNYQLQDMNVVWEKIT